MKVLVLGSGGREHALAYMLSKSPSVDRIYWTPGNAGTGEIAENPHIPLDDFQSLIQFAKQEKIELTVVGPELPLVNSIADIFSENGLDVFGPGAEGARIEGSKAYAKKLMAEKGIPTARFVEFTDGHSALKYVKSGNPPFVIKADGLAAGKGVIIAQSDKEAETTLSDMFEGRLFGNSGSKVVIEEFLYGEEATVLALCDGNNVVPLISSQDHKPVYDGDEGPNTGGMGAIAPAPVVSTTVMGKVIDTILLPLVHELRQRGIEYRGVIYAGLMILEDNPWVVEFNCRFGDPEAEAVFPLLDSDLFEAVYRTVKGELKDYCIKWKRGYSCDVVIVSGGYPGKYEKGREIRGLEKLKDKKDLWVFHAGTQEKNSSVVTNGGRVLNIVGTGPSLKSAIDSTYGHVKHISFENMFYRKDIGFRGLKYRIVGDGGSRTRVL